MSDFMWKVGYAAPEMCEACFVKNRSRGYRQSDP